MTSSSEQVLSQQTSKKQISPSRRGFIAFVSVALFSTVLFGASVTLTHPAAAQTTPLNALSSTGCTDGTYVNTTNDPRVSGDNNDLVEDCLAIVAIQNSWATSANAGLTSGAALRSWGTGLISTWSGLTVGTVSGANRVTELESIGRRRGRFLNTQITGVLPADIGNLTALTKLSLPGNRLSSIPTEITNLTSLSELNLFQNRITGTIPSAIGSMTALTVLNLANNQLSGSIPSGIGSLTSLTELSLYNNSLIGGIPSGVGNLTSLTKLFLDNNSLSGTIPVEIGTATALTRLQLNDNQLTGGIPTQLGSLTSLTQLYLNDNRLSGAIPTQLGSLTSLTQLHLDNNRLSGSIPTQLGSLTSLTELHLNNNELSGAVPTQLGSLSSLSQLALCTNKLTGNLPNGLRSGVTLVDYPTSQGYEPVQCQAGPLTTLSDTGCSNGTFVSASAPRVTGNDNDLVEDCVSLVAAYNAWAADTQNQSLVVNHPMRTWGASTTVRLDRGQWSGVTVSSNRVTRIEMGSFDLGGTIPTELGKLTALQGLDLSGNRLTGSIPTELGSLTQLFHELSLQNNQLSGTIPTQLGSLTLLKEMNLSNNALTGTIPTELGSLAALRNLNLGRNRLWGSIPSQLSSLTELRQLHLNDNLFSGALPAQLNSIAAPTNGNLSVVSICNNYLTGAVPLALRTASVSLTSYPTAQGYATIACQNSGNPPQPAPQPGTLPTSNIVFTAPTGLSLSQNWPQTIDASSYAADGPYVITCGTPASVSATLTVTNLGSCRYTLSTSSTSGSLSFNIPYTSSGGDTETGTISLTATPRHTISFTAPTGLTIGTDQDITIDLTSSLSVTNGTWTIACSDASSTTNINAVIRNGCSFTLTAASSQGTASFTVAFTSSGGATAQGVITFTVGAASNIAFTAPTNLSVNSGSNLTVNAATYASDGSYTISCGDATNIHSRISSISRTGCSYTVTAGSRGGTATFTVPYTSSGGDTQDGQISITINAASSILFTAPTDLETSIGTTITVDAALYADDGTFTISCGTATSVSSLITINSRNDCSYNITAGNTQGTASFTVPYTSSGSTTATGTISITIGPTSNILFTAPTNLTAPRGGSIVVPAGDYATDGNYTITCEDAVQLNPTTRNRETLDLAANNLVSISKTDCNYTVAVANNQGATATFTVPYNSTGGDTHLGTISISISAAISNIVFTAPRNLKVGTNRTLTINAASYAADGTNTITCGTATNIAANVPNAGTVALASVVRDTSGNGCGYTITPTSAQGTAAFTIPYFSSGGHTLDATVTLTVGAASTITYTPPASPPAVAASASVNLDVSGYAADGDYTITCGTATSVSALITINSRNGCSYNITAGGTNGVATFTVPYASDGGHTLDAVITLTVGPASLIMFSPPALSGVVAGSSVDIDASSYATDGSYTISCGDAVGSLPAGISISRTGCSYRVSATSSATGSFSFTAPLSSTGGDTLNGTIAMAVSGISFTAPTGLSVAVGQVLVIDAADYASDGNFAISCATATGVDSKITVTNVGCSYAITAGPTTGSASFTVPYTSAGGDTESGTISVTINTTPLRPVPALDATGCTDGTFVNTTTNPRVTGANNDLVEDCQALVAIQNHWAGVAANRKWTSNQSLRIWGTGANEKINTWPNVTVSSSRVTSLVLTHFHSSGDPANSVLSIHGTLPAELGNLTALTTLQLNDNVLSGPIPTQLGNLTALTDLRLYQNQLTGTIPTQLGNLTALVDLQLNDNQLTGTIPTQLGSLTSLEFLYLDSNRLSGTIPTQLGNLTNAFEVTLENNLLTGTIPQQLSGLSSVEDFRLDNNLLTGTIPTQLAALAVNLISNGFSICGNYLTGAIPTALRTKVSDDYPTAQGYDPVACQNAGSPPTATSDITYTPPAVVSITASGSVTIDALAYANDDPYTITCADATNISASLTSVTRSGCLYTITAANTAGDASFTIPYTSSGTDTENGLLNVRILPVSNITYTAPTGLQVARNSTLVIDASDHVTENTAYAVSCADATGVDATRMTVTRGTGANACTFTVDPVNNLAPANQGNTTFSVVFSSTGGSTVTGTFTVNIGPDSNISFTAPSNLSARVGQSLDITATTYATDGSYTITCAEATGDDITNNKISVSNTGCVFRVSHAVAYTGSFSFSTLLTSSGGATQTAVFSVLFNTVQGDAIPALGSAGCTDGSYVDTSTDPRVSGNNNDLVEDCLAVVAIQNSWATSANANLPDTFALRRWGVGRIDTWPALTVGTVSGARRVTEFESNGRRRGRFADTRITGALPADIGNLTALTKLSLSGNRLSTLPTEITNLTSLSELNLFGNRISSSIPADIGNMTALTVLNLANNQLSGSIPSGIGSLTSLTELSLYNNSLVGGIPSGLGSLTSLTRLYLDNNSLSGSIPTQLGNATALTRLQLNDNQLTGSIPTQLGSLTSLTQLYLNDNRLSGAIPTQLGSLTSLTQLHLDNNRLSGAIPTQLGSLTSLTDLMLNNNELSGAVPSQLGSLSALSRLGLCANRLTDNLPNGLRSGVTLVDYPTASGYEPIQCQAGPLAALSDTGCSNGTFVSSSVPRVSGNDNDLVEDCIALVAAYNAWAADTQNQSLALDHPMRSWGVGSNVRLDRNRWSGITVSSNRITRIEMGSFDLGGSIPADLGKLTALRGLDLSNNRLSGSIPAELGSLTQLFHELSLQNNQLSGTIPTQLGSLVLLKEMNLSNNALTGTIPTQLGSLAALRILNLGQNRLWGSIPTQLSSLTELRQLHLNDNLLSGVLPAQLNSIAAPTNGNLSAVSVCNNYLTGAVPLALRTASVSLTDYPTAQGYATIACQNSGNPPQPAPQPGPLPTSNIVFTAPTGLSLSQNWPITIDASSYAADGPYVITCGTPASVSATLTVTNLGSCRYTLSTSSTSGSLSFNVPYTSSGGDTETGTITLTATPRHTISFTAPTGLTVGIGQDITIDLTSRLSVTSGSWTIACSDASSTSNINAVIRNGCSFTLTAASSQGTASFTVAFTSSGGATSTGVVSFTVGAASNISFTAPTNLSVNSGSNLTVNAATYASDGSYTISCGDATDVHARISSISRTGCSYTVTAGARGGTATFTVPYVSSGGDTEDGQISITINAASSILFTAPTDLETSVGTTITVDAALYADDGTFTISCGTATSVSSLITINSRNGCSYNITAGNTQGTATFTVPYSSSGSTTATGTISITIGPASNILFTAPTNLIASAGVAIVVPAGDYVTDGNYTITCEDAVQINPTTRNRETLNLAANNLVSISKTDCNYTVTVTNNPGSTATFTVPYNSTGGDTHLGTISIAISAVTSNIVYTAPTNLTVDTSGTLTINAASYAADGSFTITCGTATESSPLISITSQNGCSINISAGTTTGTATISVRYTSSGGHTLDATITVNVRTPSNIVFTDPGTFTIGRNRTLVIDASSTVADGSNTITCGDATGVDTTKMTVTRGTGANACSFTVDPLNNLAASAQGDATFSVLFTSSGGDTESGEFTVNIGPDSNIRADNLPTFANPLFFTANVRVNFSRFASDGDYEIFCTSVTATTGTISNRAADSCIFDYTQGGNNGRFDVSFRSAGGSTTTGRISLARSFGTYLRSANFPTRTIPVGTKTEINAGDFISVYTFNTYFCFEPTNVDSKITVILRGCRYIITAGNTQGAATFTLNFRITSGEVRASTVTVNVGPTSDITFTAPTGLKVGRNRTLTIDATDYATDSSYTISCGNATGVDNTKLTSVSRNGCEFTVDPINSLAAGSQGDATFSVPFTSSGGDTETGTFTVNVSGDSTITYTGPTSFTRGRNLPFTIDASDYVSEVSGSGYTITCGDATSVDTVRLTSVTRTANTCSYTITPNTSATAGAATFTIPFTSDGGHSITRTITVNVGLDSALTFTDPGTFTLGRNRTLVIDALAATSGENAAYTVTCADATGVDANKMTVTRSSSGDGCSFTVDPVDSLVTGSQGDTTFSVAFSSTGGATASGTFTVNIGPDSTITTNIPPATGAGRLLIGRNQTLVIDASDYVTEASSSYTISCSDARNLTGGRLASVTRTANTCSYTITPNTSASSGQATFTVTFTSTGGHSVVRVITVNVGPNSAITLNLPPTTGAGRLLTGRNRALVVDAGSYASETAGSGYTITCGDATSIDSTRLASVTHTGSSCSFTVTPVSTLSSTLQATNATFTVPYSSSGGATANGIISVKIGPDSTMTFTAPTGLKVGRNRTLVIDAAAAISGEDSGYTISCGDATGVDASRMAVTHTGSSCSFTVDPVNNLASGSQGDTTFSVAFTSTGGATASGTFTVNIGPDSTITYSTPGTLTVGRNRTLTIDASDYVAEVSGSGHTISCANAAGIDSTRLTSVTRTANSCSFTITPISTLTPAQQGNATFTITFTSDGGHSITRTITVNVGPDSTITFTPPASNIAIAASRTRTIDVGSYAADGSYTISCGTITESSALIRTRLAETAAAFL